jgi:anthranilate synthase/indole-3-glycerol phosphate synthase/phosphoribosylanthranilate isomerase
MLKGSLLDMRLARAAADSLENRPAILRKEFILDDYQITEARVHGVVTILLSQFSSPRIAAFFSYARTLGEQRTRDDACARVRREQ